VLGIARIEGDYHYDASSDFPHRRVVVWLSTEGWKMPNPESLQTVREIKKYPENILEVTRCVLAAPPATSKDGPCFEFFSIGKTGFIAIRTSF
jgi:hypothetical protein